MKKFEVINVNIPKIGQNAFCMVNGKVRYGTISDAWLQEEEVFVNIDFGSDDENLNIKEIAASIEDLELIETKKLKEAFENFEK